MNPEDRASLTTQIAYRLYLHRGRHHGNALADWVLAEQLVALVEALLVIESVSEGAPAAAEGADQAPPSPPQGGDRRRASEEVSRRALALVEAAVESSGRAVVAEQLGYASTSSVGKLLRRKSRLTLGVVERILAALEGPAAAEEAPTLRVLPGREAA
ncbi:MAG TPA: hypothetical protein DEA08_22550 [Planctomycetes bacterium]|nr:hypothetical protein [Planctomycetota bacterium]